MNMHTIMTTDRSEVNKNTNKMLSPWLKTQNPDY